MAQEIISTAKAKELQTKINAINKQIAEIKSKIANGSLTFSEKWTLKREIGRLIRERRPLTNQMKYTLHYIKQQQKLEENVGNIEKYNKGK